ncbi:putative ribonuclease H-like domain-containing protein, partial [Tanacetum coccineum]
DVKSAFLYGTIEEEVYVCQPPGFEDPQFPDIVYMVYIKLLEPGMRPYLPTYWKMDTEEVLLIKLYSSRRTKMMHKRFQMSSIGELTFFLELKVQQKEDGILISQDKYVADILKKFDFVTVKTTSTPMEPNKALVKDEEADNVDVHLYRLLIRSLMYLTASRPDIPFDVCACGRDSPFDLEAFFESDYVGASLDKKFTTGAEYVAAANCCGQVLWIQNQMLDYGFNFMNTKIYVDNESIICIVKNPVIHSKTKHIEIRHHFIRDSHEKKLIQGRMITMDWRCFLDEIKDRQSSMVGFVEIRQLKVLKLILEEIRYNWYTLTKNPTIYVSLIEKFWQTATVRTVDNGEQEINATVDGTKFTITEASVRRHLQLADADGVSILPNTEIFDQLTLMGYVLTDDKLTFQKGKFSPQWRFLIHTILHCLSPKKTSWEQFSSNIATALVCLATNRTFKFSKLIFDGMVKNLDSKYKFLMYPRFIQIFLDKNKRFLKPHNRTYIAPTLTPKLFSNMKRGFSREHTPLFPSMLALLAEEGEGSGNPFEPQPPPSTAQPTHEEPIPHIESSSPQKTQSPNQALNKDIELPQTSVPITYVPDEAAYQERGDSVERAATTATILEAVQNSSNIAKTQSMATPTEPISQETSLDGGNIPRSDDDSMTLQELTALCTRLPDKVLALETDLRQTKKVYGTAYTKLIMKVKKLEKTVNTSQARRRAKIVDSDDDMDSEDSSKQGRMIEEIDQDVGVTFVTPTKVSSQEDQPEDQLGVLSAAKVLADWYQIFTKGRKTKPKRQN